MMRRRRTRSPWGHIRAERRLRANRLRRDILRRSEDSLVEGSTLPRLEMLETMTPEKREAMFALYGPPSALAERRMDLYDARVRRRRG